MKVSYKRIFSIVIVIVGCLLTVYPFISNYLYDHRVDSTVESYQKELMETEQVGLEEMKQDAILFNEQIAKEKITLSDPFVLESETSLLQYQNLMSLDEFGLMCFVDVPKINVYLPVYHGTSPEILEKGAGHLEGSSMPVGGASTHAVISAHSGINSSKMFSDLEAIEKGDLFFIHVLDEILAYRVSSISIILPEQRELLRIEKGKDKVSLLTCTPYGVNSHRLVVTGERIAYDQNIQKEAESQENKEQSQWLNAYKKALVIGFGTVAVIFLIAVCVKQMRKDGGCFSCQGQK